MLIGTTPTHIFQIPFDTNVIQNLKITYTQDGQIKLEKRYEDCSLTKNTISLRLTQEETFVFENNKNVEIQMRILTTGGDALSSDIRLVTVERCLDSEVLV